MSDTESPGSGAGTSPAGEQPSSTGQAGSGSSGAGSTPGGAGGAGGSGSGPAGAPGDAGAVVVQPIAWPISTIREAGLPHRDAPNVDKKG